MKAGMAALALMLAAGAAQAQWQPYSAALAGQAQAGDPAAQYALGEAYRSGYGVKPDREQAILWLKRAAPKDVRAADALGILLFVKGDRRQAVPLLQAASQRGDAHALYILGTARFNGDYVPKDLGAAYAEMRLAAQKGLPEAQRSLALMESHISADDRTRADQLMAQPAGPETGALPVPPPPVAKSAASAPVRTVKTPYVAAASDGTAAVTPAAPSKLATIELPPSQAPAAPLATVAAPVVHTPAAPAKPAATGGWRVQLASVGSPDAAESEWKRLSKKAPYLAPLDHAAVSAGAKIRLQATGIASKADAAALCQKLIADKLDCFVAGTATP